MAKTKKESKKEEKGKKQTKQAKVKKEEKKYLVDLDLYIKTRIYVGHKIITPDMRQYVFRRKADGVAVFNTDIVDQKIREAVKYLAKFKPEDILLVGKKPQCHKALKKFAEVTGVKVFIKKYPAGIITNPNLPNFMEPKLMFIVDPVADKNALHDANIVGIPVLALCNSNHYTKGIDFVLPVNNKDEPALNLLFYLLAKGYLEAQGIKGKVKLEDFLDVKALEEEAKEKEVKKEKKK